jgi:hypothetical protein
MKTEKEPKFMKTEKEFNHALKMVEYLIKAYPYDVEERTRVIKVIEFLKNKDKEYV